MKKFFITLGIILLGIILYLLTGIIGISILLPFLIIIHIILSILFVKKNYKKKCIYWSISIFLVYVLLLIIPFPVCTVLEGHPGWKYPQATQKCDCIGITKAKIKLAYTSQCIGVITDIYINLPQTQENCESHGAEYKDLQDPCLNNCWAERRKLELGSKKLACGGSHTFWGCSCGEGNCWNGTGCEQI